MKISAVPDVLRPNHTIDWIAAAKNSAKLAVTHYLRGELELAGRHYLEHDVYESRARDQRDGGSR